MDRFDFDLFILIIELISIGSFGISGALTAIKKQMDPFGVIMVAITTSIGGGIIRDLVLGIHPPKSFNMPIYALMATIFATITFIIEYQRAQRHEGKQAFSGKVLDKIMFWLDTLGLSIYTMVGVSTGYEMGQADNTFVLCFVGFITGVGGGLLRDIMTGNPPYIFVKHFYASPCIIGSLVCVYLWSSAGRVISMLVGMGVIILLRCLAAHYRWNLPHVPASLYQNPPSAIPLNSSAADALKEQHRKEQEAAAEAKEPANMK